MGTGVLLAGLGTGVLVDGGTLVGVGVVFNPVGEGLGSPRHPVRKTSAVSSKRIVYRFIGRSLQVAPS
jgi:hypothetical protein